MQSGAPRKISSRISPALLRHGPAYLLAVVLPLLSSIVTQHSDTLKTVPFSLYFISIAVIGSIGGIFPALLAVTLSMLSHNYFLAPTQPLLRLDRIDLLRLCVLLGAAIAVSVIEHRRRRSAAQLVTTVAALQERTEALSESLHSGKCASWILDLDSGRSARWFRGSYEVFGRPFAEIEQLSSLQSLLHPEDVDRFPALVHAMRTSTEPVAFEFRAIWPNGELHWLDMRATRVPGKRIVWRGLTMDLTDRKQAESALLNSEKLAAMGRLASTVAHEINNPLEAVTNLLFLARADPHLTEETNGYLTTAEQELARLGNITRLTLGFVRNSSTRQPCDIANSIEEVLAIFRHRSNSKGIDVQGHFEPGIQVLIAPHELRQILTNLISNALDALGDANMPSASPVPAQPPRLVIRVCRHSDRAQVELLDNGSGIPPGLLARIFEPFFTTKQDVGTGIGLWVTRELVENNGGTITAESGELPDGMRTRFAIEFPLTPALQERTPPMVAPNCEVRT